MKFKKLLLSDKDLIKKLYASDKPRAEVQEMLSEHFDVSKRTIRDWANKMQVGVMSNNVINPAKVLIYDIETSRVSAKLFWTGKTYINYKQIKDEPRIITVSWKWL